MQNKILLRTQWDQNREIEIAIIGLVDHGLKSQTGTQTNFQIKSITEGQLIIVYMLLNDMIRGHSRRWKIEVY